MATHIVEPRSRPLATKPPETARDDAERADPTVISEPERGSDPPAPDAEFQRCLFLQLAMCGVAIDGNAARFVKTIAEILLWSAEHARIRAGRSIERGDRVWCCPTCREAVPENFDLCWSCETPQPADVSFNDAGWSFDEDESDRQAPPADF